jgi:hypothetical protein
MPTTTKLPTIKQVGTNKWVVRYFGDGDYFGDYIADSAADARGFANSPERQAADRAFAVLQFKTKMGL